MAFVNLFHRYYPVLLIIVFFGCKNEKEDDDLIKSTKTITHKVAKSLDTISLKCCNNYIIGYSLGQNEYDKLDSVNKSEYDEGYSDFIYNLEEYSSKVDTLNIKIRISASRFIKFKDHIIDKKMINSDFGLLFVNSEGKYYIDKDGLLESEIRQISDSLFDAVH